jgi:hypothetical protein
MMIVWRTALQLHFLIEDEVLYMLAKWEGRPTLWGPPLGSNVRLRHVRRAFELLRIIDLDLQNPVVLYLSEDHALWPSLASSEEFAVSLQASEYVYDVASVASLTSPEYKKKRHSYKAFNERYRPTVTAYSPQFATQCLNLLDRWATQKAPRVQSSDKQKFELERYTCSAAFKEGMPLAGVVATVNGEVQAFSIGSPHGRHGFNCIFEKTNLNMRGASAFIFSEFARSCLGKYSEINAGEDWGVEYLAESKRLWKPSRTEPTYLLSQPKPPRANC